MKTGYRALLLAGVMIGVAVPAFPQPKTLLTDLSRQPALAPMQSNPPFLAAAHEDVEGHRWNAAEVDLEHSEIFLLNGGVKSSNGVVTSPSPAMAYVIQARMAAEQRDQVDALLAINTAISKMFPSSGSSPLAVVAPPMPAATFAASVITQAPAGIGAPVATRALFPGHWQLTGWQYHWVSLDTSYRTVQANPFITGHYEYRGGAWTWIAGHYGKDAG